MEENGPELDEVYSSQTRWNEPDTEGMGSMNLGIAGQSIERISLDYALTLVTDDGSEIRIQTTFSLRTPSGEVLVVDPERPGRDAEAMTLILHEMILGATAADDIGTLVLDLVNGIRLEVGPSDLYEAWAFTGRDGSKFVARPGGGLVTWAPDLCKYSEVL